MPAKTQFLPFVTKPLTGLRLPSKTLKKPLWVIVLISIVALAAWVNNAGAATSSPTTATAMAPALKLAIGTLNLEGTDQAIDAASATKLLPLWQLLEQLDTSGSAAPEEITAVVHEIQLTMTSAQIKAIDAMSIGESQLAGSSGAAPSTAASSTTKSSTQVASASADPALGGMPADAAPMDAGGPMPSAASQIKPSSKTTSTSASPAVIKQVIQLLETKVQS